MPWRVPLLGNEAPGAAVANFTDFLHSTNGLPFGMLRSINRNEQLLGSQVGEIIDDAEKFSVSIDARNFAPNEITVNVEGHELKISAKHVGDPKNGKVTKQFERRYIIPNDVVTDRNETSISPDGILTVTLSKKRLPP